MISVHSWCKDLDQYTNKADAAGSWCEENITKTWEYRGCVTKYGKPTDRIFLSTYDSYICFAFNKKSDAMHFKLRWA